MDATPVTLGQEFGGYAAQVDDGIARLRDTLPRLCVLPLGGTAVGTGINAPKGFARKVITRLAQRTGPAAHRGEGSLRRAGRARRARRDERSAARARGVARQDRQRPALDGERPAHRPRRDPPARSAARLVDHAGQGEPGDPRGRHPGRRAGDGQRRDDRRSRGAQGNFELNVFVPVIARNLLESIGLLTSACTRVRREVHRRHRGQRRPARRRTRSRRRRSAPRSTRTSATRPRPTIVKESTRTGKSIRADRARAQADDRRRARPRARRRGDDPGRHHRMTTLRPDEELIGWITVRGARSSPRSSRTSGSR